MKRGFEAVLADLDQLAAKPLPEALKAAGMQLVMKVGGASGPLYGTLFMTLGKSLPEAAGSRGVAAALQAAIDAVKARGKADVGQKTMLDVLVPVQAASSPARGDLRQRRGARACGRRGDHPDEGDARPRLVPRRALDRPHGSGRALERAHRSTPRSRRSAAS